MAIFWESLSTNVAGSVQLLELLSCEYTGTLRPIRTQDGARQQIIMADERLAGAKTTCQDYHKYGHYINTGWFRDE